MNTLALTGAEKSVAEKWNQKGNDKQEMADSLIHKTIAISNISLSNFKILGFVVPMKSLTKIGPKSDALTTAPVRPVLGVCMFNPSYVQHVSFKVKKPYREVNDKYRKAMI